MGTTFIQELLSLADDPTKLLCWWVILTKPGISVDEIRDKTNVKGNKIYYHLQRLEAKKLVMVEVEGVPSSNLTRKTYYPTEDLFLAKKNGTLASQVSPRDTILFELVLMIGLLTSQVRSLERDSETTQDSFDNVFGEVLLYPKEDAAEVRRHFDELKALARKAEEKHGTKKILSKADQAVVFANVRMP